MTGDTREGTATVFCGTICNCVPSCRLGLACCKTKLCGNRPPNPCTVTRGRPCWVNPVTCALRLTALLKPIKGGVKFVAAGIGEGGGKALFNGARKFTSGGVVLMI